MYALLTVIICCSALPAWEFNDPGALDAWRPNEHITDLRIEDGALKGRTVDHDPILVREGLSIEASPWQYVSIRLKASQTGGGELFWTGDTSGPFGGLTQEKKEQFSVPGGQWRTVTVFPFWQGDAVIKTLRLDLFGGADFAIDWIRLGEWGRGQAPLQSTAWTFDGDSGWRRLDGTMVSPPLAVPAEHYGWLTLTAKASKPGAATLLWGSDSAPGMRQTGVFITAAGETRTYNVELQGEPGWTGHLAMLGLRGYDGLRVESIALNDGPAGPSQVEPVYFGFENAPNRAGRPLSVLAMLTNTGGEPAEGIGVELETSDGLRIVETPESETPPALAHGERQRLRWRVRADAPGRYRAALKLHTATGSEIVEAELEVGEALTLEPSPYVPKPRPVETPLDVLMYYFPGWNAYAKWSPIRNVAPERKPVLGYYDESKAEVVDWQIKWAVENGVDAFLVDWYWMAGGRMLEHWLNAYKHARYAEQLDIALMWANHNPPGTHSATDMEDVARHWVENYFHLDTYYRIDGKPAVFMWSPSNIRNDLGGSDAAAASMARCQEIAREAGYEGVTFVALHGHDDSGGAQRLAREGYHGATSYHEWGEAPAMAESLKQIEYEDVAATAPATWERRRQTVKPLVYYPVVDTGWDARPWHGNQARVIRGRTPALFAKLLRDAKAYCAEHGIRRVILGPANEWGEGSYVEPCTEFGFEMYEAIRNELAAGSPGDWPVNVAPADLGLGPYDLPAPEPQSAWTFEADAESWAPMMGLADVRAGDGALRARTVSDDPAFVFNAAGLEAGDYGKAYVVMRLEGGIDDDAAQLFWSADGAAMGEAASRRTALKTDGQTHRYVFGVKYNPRWRGSIGQLRFDPCSVRGVEVVIEEFGFE